jgi:uncharacterized membrane protein
VVQKNHTYRSTASIAAMSQNLRGIAQLQQDITRKKTRFTWIAVGAFAGAFISVFVTTLMPPIRILLIIVGVFLGIYAAIMVSHQGKIEFVKYRYSLLERLLNVLGRDIQNSAHVNLVAVFSKPNLAQKKQDTIPHPIRKDWKLDRFCDRWLDLKGRFLDGSRFDLSVTEFYQKAYGWKRGSSGKSKYKTKSKSKGWEVALTLKYSARKYGATQVLQQEIRDAIQLPNQSVLKELEIKPKSIHLVVKVKPEAPNSSDENLEEDLYRTITMMFLSLYQILNLAKLLSRPKGA